MVITVCSKPEVQWVAPPAGRPDVGTRLPFLFRATPAAEPDQRSLRSKANNCRGRAFRRHARQAPRRYEPVAPCVPSSIRAIGARLVPPTAAVGDALGGGCSGLPLRVLCRRHRE